MTELLLWLCVPWLAPFEVFGGQAVIPLLLLAVLLWSIARKTDYE